MVKNKQTVKLNTDIKLTVYKKSNPSNICA